MHPNSLKTTSLLLGAALAGLAGVSTEAQAATIFTETTDFSEDATEPTDLTTTWANFVTSGGIAGSITIGTDYADNVRISAPANTLVTIPISFTSTVSEPYLNIYAFDGEAFRDSAFYEVVTPGQTYSRDYTFMMPSSGQIVIGLFHESGPSGTINYTIGATVPEASTSMLGLAGMAAAALRRRRKDS
ncbi:MAG: hypothetical protein EOP88_09515 [Verrucomicrobiaceae bacterium]|nr:MAG: hypothetical protein EOP88_09515 [Verrucomicrobiaceae bacterium]